MSFNIALSGLKASSIDLDTTGNNIANASTVGFKKSRAEFGDLYSSGLLNLGGQQTGDGVRVQDVRQQFQQGNITLTDNGLDLAIDGDGFFVMDNNGENRYTRAGQFGVDQNGNITNNQGMVLQGFTADGSGNIGDIRGNLSVDSSNLLPKRTTAIDANLNLDSRQEVLASRFSTFNADGNLMGAVVPSTESNFPAETWTVTDPDGREFTLNTQEGSAGAIAATLSQQSGVLVSATTTSRLTAADFNPEADDQLTINNASYDLGGLAGADGLAALAQQINAAPPQGVRADIDEGGNLRLLSNQGDNVDFDYAPQGAGSLLITGNDGGNTEALLNGGNGTASVRGVLDFTVDNGFQVASGDAGFLDSPAQETQVNNAFNPSDPRTYNHSTSTTIFDSLGNSHELSKFFVKEPSSGPNPSNLWTMHTQIDGRDIGSPDLETGEPTPASFSLRFNSDGTLDETLSDEVLISNWVPRNNLGEPNGAAGPNNGGTLPVPEPPTSSNFAIDLLNTTQVGSEFSVNDLQQNGFATGRLSGLDVSNDGIIFARYTNGESTALGQVALANFRNQEGLAPASGTTFAESFESGNAVIGRPNSGPLGSIAASSVEESNVDLSQELVGLIVAQRNFQANAKTIESSDQITQTIINLR
ncbi:MAG: flagellar hook protein FlgE [Halomonadaceae bacterium]|nr:MAG: flagellar hook protein FlgE [Halomonadaceae bacterium]